MPVRNTDMDDEVHKLIKHTQDRLDQWVEFGTDDPDQFFRTLRWFVYSKNSPLGWSPDGRPQTATHSFDLMWKLPGDLWTRDRHVATTIHTSDGLRLGRVKLRHKRRTGHADDSSS